MHPLHLPRTSMALAAPAGARIRIQLTLTATGGLLIEVRDLVPAFERFEEVVQGTEGRGLWEVRRLGAEVGWYLHGADAGKTVHAELPARPASGLRD
ncbi:ATP-binding protein [Streptomyces sp. RerS4]|uniref:ATP-binding protein n=1 Tax=Streptomyces sp. RerS4 TaxID=2942449 RepID=UPI00201BB04B|nr:ATP-binding protein [Streptomyces sp. RerS4]UQW99116.1 hypothetical protein M4D82_00095 [Streptomyces sp. RerS4]